MPKEKPIVIDTPKLLKRNILDALMFGYVIGTRVMPSITIKRAIEMFMDDFSLGEDDYPLTSAYTVFYQMFNEFKTYKKD